MELIKQRADIEDAGDVDGLKILRKIELAGRTCYKSEDKNPDFDREKTKQFVADIIKRGHHSVIEHGNLTARFVTNRGVTHELVRHRLAAYSQESTRYCSYGGDHVKFIIPTWSKNLFVGEFDRPVNRTSFTTKESLWHRAMLQCEKNYKDLLKENLPPQHARGVLPIDLKTEIVVTANLREWRHIFSLRCAKAAHPQIRALMTEFLGKAHAMIPVVFDDLADARLEEELESKPAGKEEPS